MAIENLDVFADKNDPMPAPHAESGFRGLAKPATPVGLVVGESEGIELVLVSENGRSCDTLLLPP